MELNTILKTVDAAKKASKKRNFKQTLDLIITLKDIDMKKPDNQLTLFVNLNHPIIRKKRIAAFVGPEMKEQAKAVCDETIDIDDFPKYQADKKLVKKLASTNDVFIAQANIMPKIATIFGRALGTKGKMPNPKAGCIVPPNANLRALYDKLQLTVKVISKEQYNIKVPVGTEESSSKEVAENILTVYNQVVHHLANGENNVKNVIVKTTMGSPIKIGEQSSTNNKK